FPIEAAANRIIGEKVLRALLARAAGDVEVCVEQQRVAGSHGVRYHAERIAPIAVLPRRALELLADRGGLLARAVGIHRESETQVQRPLKTLGRTSYTVA